MPKVVPLRAGVRFASRFRTSNRERTVKTPRSRGRRAEARLAQSNQRIIDQRFMPITATISNERLVKPTQFPQLAPCENHHSTRAIGSRSRCSRDKTQRQGGVVSECRTGQTIPGLRRPLTPFHRFFVSPPGLSSQRQSQVSERRTGEVCRSRRGWPH